MEELLQRILTELSEIQRTMATKQEVAEIQRTMATKQEVAEIQRTMATKQEVAEIQRTMDETKQEVAEIQRTMDETKREVAEIQRTMAAKQDVAEIIALLQSYHAENIAADKKLLEGIRTTKDRLDFQRAKLGRAEEEIYLLARKQ